MKKLILASLLALSGCISTPLPSMKADLNSGKLDFRNLQDRNLEGLEIVYKSGTNSTTIKVKRDTAQVNTNAIQSAVDGQVQMMKTVMDGVSDVASKVAEGAARGVKK